MIQWAAAMFWSYSARAWCGIFAHLPNNHAIVRHELTWITTPPERAAKDLAAFLKTRKIELSYLVAQPKIFPKPDEYGETVSETFSRAGIPMRRGHDDPIAGWQRVRSWLDVDDGVPRLTIHRSCRQLLRTLPTLVSASSNPDDIDDVPDAYPARAVSYWAMSRPSAAEPDEPELPDGAIGHDVNELRNRLQTALY